jgi:signal transduction histidine kinase
MLTKKNTVVLLRWVLIIAFSYLLLLGAPANKPQIPLLLVIVGVLASNLIVVRMPDAWIATPVFDLAIVLFDSAWVTVGLVWAPHVSGDLFLLYFLVIFVASMGESLGMIVGSAVLVSLVYSGILAYHSGTQFRLTTAPLLRVPFLFVVALFYGYFVTELRGRRAEAAEARVREEGKTELLAAVSHDLRGPLGNAENLLGLALDAQANGTPPQRELLLRVQVNVRRVTALVSNLLDAACIEAGKVRFQWAPVQVNDIIDDVFELEAGAAQLNGVALTKRLDPHLPVLIADYVQVGRILVNLVNNAIKYTNRGGTVTVRTAFTDARVKVIVEDTGPGMSPAQCAALFAPYRRVHLGGYKQGQGLGLYIAKRLSEALGGSVQVCSQPGFGSTFTLTLSRVRKAPTHIPERKTLPAGVATVRTQRAATVGEPHAA